MTLLAAVERLIVVMAARAPAITHILRLSTPAVPATEFAGLKYKTIFHSVLNGLFAVRTVFAERRFICSNAITVQINIQYLYE